jgi:DNA-binding transcriptional ArsR family regulator
MPDDMDRVWKALADETRRAILDLLRARPRTTTEVVEQFPKLSRFGVMKHIDVLRQAGLILTRDDGRKRINTLNAVPIRKIYERWVSKYEGAWADTLLRIQNDVEPVKQPPGESAVLAAENPNRSKRKSKRRSAHPKSAASSRKDPRKRS